MLITQKLQYPQRLGHTQVAQAKKALQHYRRLTLALCAVVIVAFGSGLAWLAGALTQPATADWDSLIMRIMVAGIACLLYRELWLIQWAARAGAPYPTYRDPWGRSFPSDHNEIEG